MSDRHPQSPCGLCGETPRTTLHTDGSIRGTFHRCPNAIRDGVDDPPFLWPQGRYWPEPGTVPPTPAAAPRAGAEGDAKRCADVLALIDRAEREVSDLCHGRRRWTMSIPALPDEDSDLVIGAALHAAKLALAAAPARAGAEGGGEGQSDA